MNVMQYKLVLIMKIFKFHFILAILIFFNDKNLNNTLLIYKLFENILLNVVLLRTWSNWLLITNSDP